MKEGGLMKKPACSRNQKNKKHRDRKEERNR